ncbi:MAG: hypothetical protein A3B68_06215 [Candidatus Melainabacteria bacterium RIFCSPHIGHO2_02_FULL_34_12]|nr:MAG: hypothetical protein A3B68_06215 [Candidatus Melainabacteria bacterium RIFCSPHIGHO2_02_FULL_34_12]
MFNLNISKGYPSLRLLNTFYLPNLILVVTKGLNTMATVTEEFRVLAKGLSELYQQRKDIAKDIIFKEDRLRKLGLILEFADNLEEKLSDEEDQEVAGSDL